MKKACILTLSLMMVNMTASTVSAQTFSAKRGRVSRAYHHTCDKVCKHKGKACVLAGAAGALLIRKAFSHEWNAYVKPFVKSVGRKVYNFFKRIFKGNDRENIK